MKKQFGLFVLVGALALTGCEKKTETPPQNPPAAKTDENPLNAPANYVGALVKGQNSAIKTIDLAGINGAISRFMVEEARYPKDLNELVEKKYLPAIPEPPRGMKYVYNAETGQANIVK
jgi:hypothetical protein